MSYTEIYRKIYEQIKFDQISHEEAHRISLLITDAISNLGLIIKENSVQLQKHSLLTNTVNEIVNKLIEDDYRHQHGYL